MRCGSILGSGEISAAVGASPWRYTVWREARVLGPLGLPEIVLIFVVALLLFGPRQMPQIGRTIGRALGEFRRASEDFKKTIEDEVAAEDIRQVERDLRELRNVGRDVGRDVTSQQDRSADAPETKGDASS